MKRIAVFFALMAGMVNAEASSQSCASPNL